MRRVKKLLKYIGIILAIPILYLIISLILTYIPVNNNENLEEKGHNIYLSSNGVHLEIILHKNSLNTSFLKGLKYNDLEQFLSFGWGDKTFYIKTSTWGDFTITNKCKAVFVNTPALLHVTRYTTEKNDWINIKMTPTQFANLTTYINNTFKLDASQQKIILPGSGYYKNDDFYEAKGSYNCFNTCNTWVNTGFKQSNLKACLWTPYDFGLLSIHKKLNN